LLSDREKLVLEIIFLVINHLLRPFFRKILLLIELLLSTVSRFKRVNSPLIGLFDLLLLFLLHLNDIFILLQLRLHMHNLFIFRK
jgi:hypothetical protein